MVVDSEKRLQILDVTVARTMKDTVLVSKGIPSGSQVVISAIETPVAGMQVDIDSTPKKVN